MGYKVILTAQADRDLEKIVHFLAIKNPSAARRLGHALLDNALTLAQLPRRGVVVAGRAEYRRILHRPWFLIYFRINESSQLIEVVRIWDARQDPTNLMLG
jgi:toxin ParE1/3/4